MGTKCAAVTQSHALEWCLQIFALPSATFLATALEELLETIVASGRVVQYNYVTPSVVSLNSKLRELWNRSHHLAPAVASSVGSPLWMLDERRSSRQGIYRCTVLGDQLLRALFTCYRLLVRLYRSTTKIYEGSRHSSTIVGFGVGLKLLLWRAYSNVMSPTQLSYPGRQSKTPGEGMEDR